MDPQDAIDLGREAMKTSFIVGGPILLASLVIGLLIGVLQAMTQVQDQTVSFVPKLICMLLMIGICLPWLTDKMVEFSRETLATPMTHFQTNPMAYQAGSVEPKANDATKTIIPESSPFQLPQFHDSRLPSNHVGG